MSRPVRERWESSLRLLASACVASVVLSLVETLRLPRHLLVLRPELAVGVYVLDLDRQLLRFVGTFVMGGLVAVAAVSASRLGARRRLFADAIAAAVAVLAVRANLVHYEAFARYAPANLGLGVAFVVVTYACIRARIPCAPAVGWRGLVARGHVLIGLATGAALCALVPDDLSTQYPTLRLAQLQLAHLLLALTLWHAQLRLPPAGRVRSALRATTVVCVLACGVSAAFARSAWPAFATPYYRARTVLGAGEAVFNPYSLERELVRLAVPDDADALARFARHSGLPVLPAEFELGRYNVLLLMSEALRYDHTQLGNAALRNTPSLVKLQRSGAFSFDRAFSPSSGTFLSLSALFGMSYPSMLPLETWAKPWTGRLHVTTTAPQLFSRAGYDTFWVSHNHRRSFTQTVLGVDAGFAQRALLEDRGLRDLRLDARVADTAIEELGRVARGDRRFFGFVFFASPHGPYLARPPATTKSDSDRARYREEVRYADRQLGRVVAMLDKLRLRETTVVIVASDHGEEFGEHGGRFHKSTVYDEQVHVPLLVRIPGVAGKRLSLPTSTTYLFPWLLLRGTGEMRQVATERLTRFIGPVLRATRGAVVAEILGHDRMMSALIDPNHTVIYDYLTERHEIYSAHDARQQHDRFGVDPGSTAVAIERADEYRNVRASRRKFQLRPEVRDPRHVLTE